MNDYINKVLSYVTDRKSKKQIEYELSDHIDEHRAFLEEIGYDEENALSKAEEKMGDAEVVGEQFRVVLRSERVGRAWAVALTVLALLAVVAFYLYVLFDNYGFHYTLSSLREYDYEFFVYHYICIIHKLLLALNVFVMALGMKRGRIWQIASGYLCSLVLMLLGPYNLVTAVGDMLRGVPAYMRYYRSPDTDSFFLPKLSGCEIAIVILLSLLLTIALSIGVEVSIRTRELSNTRRDVKCNRLASLSLKVASLVVIASMSCLVVFTMTSAQRAYDYALREYTELEQVVLNNLSLFDDSVDDIRLFFEKSNLASDIKVDITDEEYFSCDIQIASKSEAVWIDVKQNEFDNKICSDVGVGYSLQDSCKHESREVFYDLLDVGEADFDFKNPQLPAPIQVRIDGELTDVYLDYKDDTYLTTYRNNGDKELLYSSTYEFKNEVKLSKKQRALINKAMAEQGYAYCTELCDVKGISPKGLKYLEQNKDKDICCCDFFEASYNPEADLYCVRLNCYSFNYYGDKKWFIDVNIKLFDYIIKLENDSALVITYISPVTKEWTKADKKRYSSKSLPEIEKMLIDYINENAYK